MLNTYLTLESQRSTALKDLDKIENLISSAKEKPFKFIKQLKKGELVMPIRQRVAQVPEINVTYENKMIPLSRFNFPTGQFGSFWGITLE